MFNFFKKKTPPPAPAITEASAEVVAAPVPAPAPVEMVVETPVAPIVVPEPVAQVDAPAPVASAIVQKHVVEEVKDEGHWWQRLTNGLTKSSQKLGDDIVGVFTRKQLDDETLEKLEDVLIAADMGPATARKITENLRKSRFGKEVTDAEIRTALADEITAILRPREGEVDFTVATPFVMLMVGVNGVGKTTTIGKLAKQLRDDNRSVLMVAGDTFRAAAVQQLQVWADRTGVPLLTGEPNSDPASLAYKAIERAKNEKIDVVLIDTAGRLHNKADLMAELQKIVRVIKKLDDAAPHATLLVLDATTGQNAHQQVETFSGMTPVNGLIVTKLDGSAKGGVLVALAEKSKIPIVGIGVGEAVADLQPFVAESFARALTGAGKA